MPKKTGDAQRGSPTTMGQIGVDLSRGIQKKDDRYQRLWNYTPIPKLMGPDGFFASKKPAKAIIGANKSSKSWACTFESICIFTGIIPPSLCGVYAWEQELRDITTGPRRRPRRVRIIVQDYTKHFPETIEPILTGEDFGMLPEAWSNYDKEERMYKGPDGSYLSIMAVNPHEKVDPHKLRGPQLDHTQIDEITVELAYTESLARHAALRDGPRTVSLGFCPQEGFDCWTFETFYKACYRRLGDRTIRLAPKDRHPEIYSIQVCMKDNPSITPEAYESQRRLYKPWEVAFRVDGEYSHRAANPYFDADILVNWELEERYTDGLTCICHQDEVDTEKGKFRGVLEKVPFELTQPGTRFDELTYPVWHVWEQPRDGEKYVMSADIAEGNDKSDPHSVSVWNATNPQKPYQAAQLHMRLIKPGELGIQAACMANVYGNCLLVPEKNNTGGGMFLDRIRNYRNLYSRITFDKITEKETEKIGWYTDRHNKGPMLNNAYTMLQKMSTMMSLQDGEMRNYCPFNSWATLMEFVGYEEKIERNKDNINVTTWSAKRGSHDDCVIDACIAFRIITHEYGKVSTCKINREVVKPKVNEHYLGKSVQSTRQGFSNWKKQPKLSTLRNRHGGVSNVRRSRR